jgi:hypothetical protein
MYSATHSARSTLGEIVERMVRLYEQSVGGRDDVGAVRHRVRGKRRGHFRTVSECHESQCGVLYRINLWARSERRRICRNASNCQRTPNTQCNPYDFMEG